MTIQKRVWFFTQMTPEARLDRLERMAKLLVRAGFSARGEVRDRDREHDKKISHLIDLQIHNEELQKQNEVRFAKLAESHASLAESQAILAQSQASTDRRLNSLIDIVREGRNGDTLRNN